MVIRYFFIPVSYNGSTKDSDSFGSSSILLTGAIPLSITVSTVGSNPAGVGSTPNRGCQTIRSEIVYVFLFFIGCRIRSVQHLKSDAMRTAYLWCNNTL